MPSHPDQFLDNLLVLGGSGFVGRSVCERLVERAGGGGGPIIVPSRHPHRARHLLPLPTVELLQADLFDDARLDALVRGRDAVINLIGILHGSDAQFQQVHVELPRRVARACAAGGVRRVVHVSALGADASAPSKYLRTKAAGEAVWHRPSIDLTVLRPSVMFGEFDRFMNRFASLLRIFPLMPLPAADAKFQPVWVDDVAEAIARSLDTPSSIGETIECVGPHVCTLKELVEAAGRWSGHRRPVIPLPDPLGRLQAALLGLLPGDPPMSRDNLDSMKVPSVASGTLPGLERFGLTPRALEAVMPGVLGPVTGPARMGPIGTVARKRS